MTGLLLHHQGWTDILNQLGLIDYYLQAHDNLKVIMRDDAAEIVNYYVGDRKNVELIYLNVGSINDNESLYASIPHDVRLFHGNHDTFRGDKYAGACGAAGQDKHFVRRFYEPYDIPYEARYKFFNLPRNRDVEDKVYREFINKYGSDYIVTHSTGERPIPPAGNNWVNLNSITNNIFTMVKVLENAKEMHLMDSVWASLCYLLDCRYELFRHKKIFLYHFLQPGGVRGGGVLKWNLEDTIYPKHPENWFRLR